MEWYCFDHKNKLFLYGSIFEIKIVALENITVFTDGSKICFRMGNISRRNCEPLVSIVGHNRKLSVSTGTNFISCEQQFYIGISLTLCKYKNSANTRIPCQNIREFGVCILSSWLLIERTYFWDNHLNSRRILNIKQIIGSQM